MVSHGLLEIRDARVCEILYAIFHLVKCSPLDKSRGWC
jgi:hypothetical protein